MKKAKIFFLLYSIFIFGYPQSKYSIHEFNFVECSYSNDGDLLVIYDNLDGRPPDTLKNDSKRCWYKVAIQEYKDGWLKIQILIRNAKNQVTKNIQIELQHFVFSDIIPLQKLQHI